MLVQCNSFCIGLIVMYLSKKDILQKERIERLNIINSITGIKPANLIGTKAKQGHSNLAIFSSVVHLGSNPALIGMITRPLGEVPRHTYENIMETGQYTINHVHELITAQAHYTSAKFETGESEFEKCNLTEEYVDGFNAPFVRESRLKMGLGLKEIIPIKLNGTLMVIGEIEHLILPEEAIEPQGHLNLEITDTVGISGLNTYYSLSKLEQYPYARPEELPDFSERQT